LRVCVGAELVILLIFGDKRGRAKSLARRREITGALRISASRVSKWTPIEQVFGKLKHMVRKAQPRDVEAACRMVGQLLNLFSPKECANYLVNSAYVSV
jgi:hypothetical protein